MATEKNQDAGLINILVEENINIQGCRTIATNMVDPKTDMTKDQKILGCLLLVKILHLVGYLKELGKRWIGLFSIYIHFASFSIENKLYMHENHTPIVK